MPSSPRARMEDGDDRVSQVPGESRCQHAVLSDPGGTSAPGHCGASVLPSVFKRTSAPALIALSRLSDTACRLAVYASQPGLPRHHARLASDRWPTFAGWDWLPTGFHREVSKTYISSPSPRLSWRNQDKRVGGGSLGARVLARHRTRPFPAAALAAVRGLGCLRFMFTAFHVVGRLTVAELSRSVGVTASTAQRTM